MLSDLQKLFEIPYETNFVIFNKETHFQAIITTFMQITNLMKGRKLEQYSVILVKPSIEYGTKAFFINSLLLEYLALFFNGLLTI